MAANGFPLGVAKPMPGQVMISIARTVGVDGFVRYTCGGSIDGLTRMTMELNVFGDVSIEPFLATIAKTIRDNISRIVAPS